MKGRGQLIHRWRLQVWVLFTLVATLSDTAQSRAEDNNTLLESIRQTWKSLQLPRSSASYRLISRMSISKPGGSDLLPVNEREMVYHDSPDGLSLDNRTKTFENGVLEKSERELLLVNKSYASRLREDVKTGQLILVDQPKMFPDEAGRAGIAESQPFHRLLWFAPARTYQLSSLIDPELTQVTKVESEGPDLIRITFRAKSDIHAELREKLRGVTSGSLLLNRRWYFRLEQADIMYAPENLHHTLFQCQFLDEPGQEYLIKTMTADTTLLGKGEPAVRSAKQVREFENLPPTDDPSIFYMSYYGLPEPEGVTPLAKPVPLWVWLLVAAGAFALLAIILRLFIRRHARIATLPPTMKG